MIASAMGAKSARKCTELLTAMIGKRSGTRPRMLEDAPVERLGCARGKRDHDARLRLDQRRAPKIHGHSAFHGADCNPAIRAHAHYAATRLHRRIAGESPAADGD